ncbi:hypothetical protein ZOSMA_66G00020 [Zostera marina]|uniref:Uncharacterized protein n=1 Tax=Zostera marina TaxID=29655 RepID=A0A0K9NSL0_ZOSMR|nr:hypothetical protein ZOSMA_66G00020 [Zostera marina]
MEDDMQSFVSTKSECFKGIALEADELLKGLQDSLCEHEERLSLFAQQRESHIRAVETARSISKINTDFFSTLDLHMVNLTKIMEERTQTAQDQKLCELEKKFEDCAANEEKQLLEKVASMLGNSSSRKKLLVQTAVDGRTQAKCCWSNPKTNQENTSLASIQWRNAQETLVSIENSNVTSIDSIVRIGIEANQKLREKLSSAASNVLQDVDVENMQFLSSVDCKK